MTGATLRDVAASVTVLVITSALSVYLLGGQTAIDE